MFYRILGIELFDVLSTINLDKLSISDLPITASPHFLFATLSFVRHVSQQRLGPFLIWSRWGRANQEIPLTRYPLPGTDGSSWYWWYFTLNGGQSDTGGAIDGLISSDRPMTQILSVKAFQWYTITADAILNEIFDQLWDGLIVWDVIVSRCFILCIFPVWVMLLSWVWFFERCPPLEICYKCPQPPPPRYTDLMVVLVLCPANLRLLTFTQPTVAVWRIFQRVSE